MKYLVLSFLILSSFLNPDQTTYSQSFIGLKGGYSRYFEPGMNGSNIAVFTEVPFGDSYRVTFRPSVFYDFPMSYEDYGNIYAKDESYLSDDYIPVYSKFYNAGIGWELLLYFDEAFSTNFYFSIKGGTSYSAIKRTVENFNTNEYYLQTQVKNNHQISVYFGIGLGVQFALGRNSFFFTEIQSGFPFLLMKGEDSGSSQISGYPNIVISGSIGFKQSIFN